MLAVARVKGGDWRWRTQIVDPRAGHPPPGRRLEIEIGDWRSQLAAAGVKWEIGDRRSERSEMCGVNESIMEITEAAVMIFLFFKGYWCADGPGSLRRHFNLRSSLWPAAPGLS